MRLLFVLTLLASSAMALDNGLALTPPMGWMTWQRFRCVTDCATYPDSCVSHKNVMDQAKLLVSQGYKKAGYEFVHIDDCFMAMDRNAEGKLYADPKRFPVGMRGLGDEIHALGLQYGLYEDIGTKTCAGYPGILGHFEIDAETFTHDWRGDFLKLDGCYVAKQEDHQVLYPEFGRILNRTGHPMVYSCSWPAYIEEKDKPAQYPMMKKHCNVWRNWDDIQDSWESLRSIIDYWGDNQNDMAPYHGPGSWNDPDMLLIGNEGLSEDQSRLQMAIWAIVAAPLIMGNDLRVVKPWQRDILLNEEIIAVDQDVDGVQGLRRTKKGRFESWSKPLHNGDLAVALVNKCDSCGPPQLVSATFETLGAKAKKMWCRDLFERKELGAFEDKISLYVNGGGGVRMLRCRGSE